MLGILLLAPFMVCAHVFLSASEPRRPLKEAYKASTGGQLRAQHILHMRNLCHMLALEPVSVASNEAVHNALSNKFRILT